MPGLHEFQQQFLNHILADDPQVCESVFDGKLQANRLLQIYRNNTFISLEEALRTHFPVVAKLVGDNYFHNLTKQFIQHFPPQSPCIFEYGNQFETFISQHPVDQQLPYLRDMAKMEWMFQRTSNAKHVDPLDLSALATVREDEYERLVFHLHPSVQLIQSQFPIYTIWQAHQQIQHASLNLPTGGEQCIIYREHQQISVLNTKPATYQFAHAIFNTNVFTQACDIAIKVDPEIDVESILQTFVINQIIVDFSLVEEM